MHPTRSDTPQTHSPSVRLKRMLSEFRQGRPVALVSSDGATSVLAAIETLDEGTLQGLKGAGAHLQVVLTVERLRALGHAHASTARALHADASISLHRLKQLAGVSLTPSSTGRAADIQNQEIASITLQKALSCTKRARLAPALLQVTQEAWTLRHLQDAELLHVHEADLLSSGSDSGESTQLRRVSDAHVPLEADPDCTLVLFRDDLGDTDHVAVIVGKPDLAQAVPVRLHSACLTGDVLGSLRCDCGFQLQQGIARLSAQGGGVLLYLDQEGRGTGLASKLRAYRLQDTGLDTIDADRHLGFSGDERDFTPAVQMLHALGVTSVRLWTNNPRKIEALKRGGLQVVERIALVAEGNPHNERYLRTKRERAGHLIEPSTPRTPCPAPQIL